MTQHLALHPPHAAKLSCGIVKAAHFQSLASHPVLWLREQRLPLPASAGWLHTYVPVRPSVKYSAQNALCCNMKQCVAAESRTVRGAVCLRDVSSWRIAHSSGTLLLAENSWLLGASVAHMLS